MHEHCENIDTVTLCTLRQGFKARQNFHKIPEWVRKRCFSGKFRRIESRDIPTVIRLADKGVVAYRVPAKLVDDQLTHVRNLETWVEKYEGKLREKIKIDPKRGVSCVRKYQRWIKYRKRRMFVPKLSGDYRADGEVAHEFMKHSELLWSRATEWFPKHHLQRVFRDLTQHPLKNGEERLCGPWMGCAVNVAVDGKPVETTPHRDVMGFVHGISCLCPFGEFTGGGLILWELRTIVELKRGDLLYFMDHLINHSNEKAYGARHSVVAFTENKVWEWLQKIYGFVDARVKPLKAVQKRYREEEVERSKAKRSRLT